MTETLLIVLTVLVVLLAVGVLVLVLRRPGDDGTAARLAQLEAANEAARQALSQVVGAYGICICSRENPDLLIAARMGSPLMLGVGEDEWFVASDASAFLEHTRQAAAVCRLANPELVVTFYDGPRSGEKTLFRQLFSRASRAGFCPS